MSDDKALVQRLDTGALIQTALEKEASVETMERLFALAKEVRAEQARAAWHTAMAGFQAEAPPVKKTKTAKAGTYSYSYAPLDELISVMRPVLASHGLSVVFKTKADGKTVMARADVVHKDGHSESCEFTVPIDSSTRMNVAQQVGSALTYARRYAYLAALGLSPEDDDDGQAAAKEQATASDPSSPRPAQPPADIPAWRGKLVKMDIKNNPPNTKPVYTAFVFLGDDGQKFGTFSKTMAEALEKFIIESRFVEIVYSATKSGNKIEEFRDVTEAEAPFAPEEPPA